MTVRVAVLDNRPDRRELLCARIREALTAMGSPWSGVAIDAYEEADELQRAGSFELVVVHKGRDQAGALDVAGQALERGGAAVIFGGLGIERTAIDLHGRVHVEQDAITAETVDLWPLAEVLGRLLVTPPRRAPDPAGGAAQRDRLTALGDPAIVSPGQPVVERVLELRSAGHFGPIAVLHDGPRSSSHPLIARWLEDRSIVTTSVASPETALVDALDQVALLDPEGRDPASTARRHLESASALLSSRAVDVDSHDLCGRTAPLRVAVVPGPLGLGGLSLFDAVRERIREAIALSPIEAVLAAAWRELLAAPTASRSQPSHVAEPFEAWIVDDHAEAGWTALLQACWPGAHVRGLTCAAAVDRALAAGGTPDLAIVDLYLDPVRDEALHRSSNLDSISGVRVRQRLHEVRPRMPIFLLTASDSFDAVEVARGAAVATSPPVGILRKRPLWSGPFSVDASTSARIDAFTGMLANVHRGASLVTDIQWLSAPPSQPQPWWHEDLTNAGASLADLAGQLLVGSFGALRFDSMLGAVAAQFSEWCAPLEVSVRLKDSYPDDHPQLYLSFLFWRTLRNVLAHQAWSADALSQDDRLRLLVIAAHVTAPIWNRGDVPAMVTVSDVCAHAGTRYWQRLGAGIQAVRPKNPFFATNLLNGRVWSKWPLEGSVSSGYWATFRSVIVDLTSVCRPQAAFELLELVLGCWLHVAALCDIAIPARTAAVVANALATWRVR